jgi:hypothetical protein
LHSKPCPCGQSPFITRTATLAIGQKSAEYIPSKIKI